ncbi:MAG: hypothetical protein J0G30_00025 [Actinomycetales bacterium]|nr:hypothetical protein [Actinomycetales bacterium]
MTFLLDNLLGGVRLLGASAAFVFTAPVLIALLLVPAAIRTYQLFRLDDSGWLEVVVEGLRVVLVVAMVLVGRGSPVSALFTAGWWGEVGRGIATAWRADWGGILVRLAVVTAIVLLFNAAVEALVTADRLAALPGPWRTDPAQADALRRAATFAVKNAVVIPVYLAAMLGASGVLGRAPAGAAEATAG